eukprot:CAMPEP_0119356596 /NCGR_PEP_ID=MMETSP1334-20130426/5166_1 /TAXON_ID=127549 /ORGANISM="Calcidiscus leptoporus, Strain RCC1130" /LENGTH=226 /DNA_ID=CAMNT_0007370669 /DNA_START=401 /DNA_END=1079 /DNA_ORIENTATION=+
MLPATTAELARSVVAGAKAAALAAGRRLTAQLAMLVDRVAEPVDTRVLTDHLVVRVNHDALVILVKGVLCNPVRVENTQAAASAADAFLGLGSQVPTPLVLVDATVARLAVVDALRELLLARTATHSHAIDHIALLGFVAKVTRFVWPGRLGCAVDHRQLTVLPATHAKQETDSVRLLLAPEFLKVLEGTLKRLKQAAVTLVRSQCMGTSNMRIAKTSPRRNASRI